MIYYKNIFSWSNPYEHTSGSYNYNFCVIWRIFLNCIWTSQYPVRIRIRISPQCLVRLKRRLKWGGGGAVLRMRPQIPRLRVRDDVYIWRPIANAKLQNSCLNILYRHHFQPERVFFNVVSYMLRRLLVFASRFRFSFSS